MTSPGNKRRYILGSKTGFHGGHVKILKILKEKVTLRLLNTNKHEMYMCSKNVFLLRKEPLQFCKLYESRVFYLDLGERRRLRCRSGLGDL